MDKNKMVIYGFVGGLCLGILIGAVFGRAFLWAAITGFFGFAAGIYTQGHFNKSDKEASRKQEETENDNDDNVD